MPDDTYAPDDYLVGTGCDVDADVYTHFDKADMSCSSAAIDPDEVSTPNNAVSTGTALDQSSNKNTHITMLQQLEHQFRNRLLSSSSSPPCYKLVKNKAKARSVDQHPTPNCSDNGMGVNKVSRKNHFVRTPHRYPCPDAPPNIHLDQEYCRANDSIYPYALQPMGLDAGMCIPMVDMDAIVEDTDPVHGLVDPEDQPGSEPIYVDTEYTFGVPPVMDGTENCGARMHQNRSHSRSSCQSHSYSHHSCDAELDPECECAEDLNPNRSPPNHNGYEASSDVEESYYDAEEPPYVATACGNGVSNSTPTGITVEYEPVIESTCSSNSRNVVCTPVTGLTHDLCRLQRISSNTMINLLDLQKPRDSAWNSRSSLNAKQSALDSICIQENTKLPVASNHCVITDSDPVISPTCVYAYTTQVDTELLSHCSQPGILYTPKAQTAPTSVIDKSKKDLKIAPPSGISVMSPPSNSSAQRVIYYSINEEEQEFLNCCLFINRNSADGYAIVKGTSNPVDAGTSNTADICSPTTSPSDTNSVTNIIDQDSDYFVPI